MLFRSERVDEVATELKKQAEQERCRLPSSPDSSSIPAREPHAGIEHRYRGVPLQELLARAGAPAGAAPGCAGCCPTLSASANCPAAHMVRCSALVTRMA